MRVLFIMDPLKKLDPAWDNSLYVSDELARRRHEIWTADAGDLFSKNKNVLARCGRLLGSGLAWPKRRYRITDKRIWNIQQFGLVLIRKEPPVNASYLAMTLLLERVASQVPIVNHPAGVRMINEKLSILDFPRWIPKTLVTASPQAILRFQKRFKSPVVVKPLDQKGGKGVFLLPAKKGEAAKKLNLAVRKGPVMVQQFIPKGKHGEKRIVILNGKVIAAYEKRPKGKEFRANLGLGASFHNTVLTSTEKKLVAVLKPYLLKHGLYFVGIDVLEGKLIEINVTSPAGVTEAKFLNPKSRPAEAWADFLERFARARKRQS